MHLARKDTYVVLSQGTLPPTWPQNLPLLRVALLNNNSIVGQLPPEWASMKNIQTLNLGFNEITGVCAPDLMHVLSLLNVLLCSRLYTLNILPNSRVQPSACHDIHTSIDAIAHPETSKTITSPTHFPVMIAFFASFRHSSLHLVIAQDRPPPGAVWQPGHVRRRAPGAGNRPPRRP